MAAVRSQSVRTSSTSARSAFSAARPPPTSSATRRRPSWRFSARWVATKTLSSTDSSANTWGLWNVLTRPREATSSGRRLPRSSPFHSTAPPLAAQVDDVRQPGEDERANYRSGQRALAAEQDHGQDLHRLIDAEITRIDVARVVTVEAAGEGGERAPQREGQQLVAEDVHAERAGEILVEADRREAAAHPRAERPDAHEDGERQRDQRHVVPGHRPTHRHQPRPRPPHRRPA